MILPRFILGRFLMALLRVQAVILALVLLFAGAENLRRFGGGEAGMGAIATLTLLQAPEVLNQILPLVVMLAALVTFLGLARSSELVVLRAAGVSALRLILIPLITAAAIGVASFALVNPVVAWSLNRAVEAEDRLRGGSGGSRLSFAEDGLWLRQADPEGQTVIQAARASGDGTVLSGVRMFGFDQDGSLNRRIDAEEARLGPGAWQLTGARRWDLDRSGAFVPSVSGLPLAIPTTLTRDQILDSFAAPEAVPFWELTRFITQLEGAGFSALRHRLFLQTELAKPVFYAGMVLIGAVFALRPARFGQTGIMVLLAVLAGFSFYFIKDFAESLGASGAIPLTVAAWSPPLAAVMLALGLLLHLEDG